MSPETKVKMTQGQVKTRAYLMELFENEIFKCRFAKIKRIKDREERNKQLHSLAEDYYLEYEPGAPLFKLAMGMNPMTAEQIGGTDVCEIYDEVDEYLNELFPNDYNIPPSRKAVKRLQLNAFPIHIGISPRATKRDVLDFISKRWEYIRDMLDSFIEKPKIVRKRPKAERDKLVWENRKLPTSDIVELVNDKYPDENITYSDVNSILYYLKRRKRLKLV